MELRERLDDHLNEVVNALRRIIQAIRLSSSSVHDALGITGAQLYVLQQLAARPGASLRQLAEATLTDQSSVSVVVRRLVGTGHVARRVAESDARRTELTLTDRGRALLRRAPRLAQTRLVASLRSVSAAQLRVTARVLERAARAVSPARAPAPMFFEPFAGKRRGGDRKPGPRSGRGRTR
jgi:MarR family transcriptional regulator, lower aerobic nicotinate degradation pathway regulator